MKATTNDEKIFEIQVKCSKLQGRMAIALKELNAIYLELEKIHGEDLPSLVTNDLPF